MTESGKKSVVFDVVVCGWVWALLAAIAATLPLRNWDYWFHLTVGRLLATHHALPDKNVFGYSAPPQTPVLIHAWIGEFWLYELHELGGLVATLAVRNLSALVAWGCVMWCVYRLTDRHGAATACVTAAGGLVFFAIGGFAGPQVFVFAPFGLLAVVCVSALSWRRALWVVPLTAVLVTSFWVNTAGNFWAPIALVASFAIGAQLQHLRRHRIFYVAAALLSFGSLFVHPHGAGVLRAFLHMAGAEAWLCLGVPMALAPILKGLPRWDRTFRTAWGQRVGVAAVGIAATIAMVMQPWSDRHRAIPAFVFGDAVRQQPPLMGYGPANTPVEAVEVLKSWGSQPRVYAAPHLSGYILYELQSPHNPKPIVWPVPDWAPTADVVEMKRAVESDREVFRGVFQQLDVRAVIVTPQLGPVAKYVVGVPDWVKVGDWPSGALYVHERRNSPR